MLATSDQWAEHSHILHSLWGHQFVLRVHTSSRTYVRCKCKRAIIITSSFPWWRTRSPRHIAPNERTQLDWKIHRQPCGTWEQFQMMLVCVCWESARAEGQTLTIINDAPVELHRLPPPTLDKPAAANLLSSSSSARFHPPLLRLRACVRARG